MDYKEAGVDIKAGEALVQWLKCQPRKLFFPDHLVSGVGGFASLFRCHFPQMKSPCLVSATDGVGTKLKLAVEWRGYAAVAQDVVAMCVNDLLCTGATPLYFLDYYATGKLELETAKEFLTGVLSACEEAECDLIGGETAEMPGIYVSGDFDCAGFAVGIVDEPHIKGPHRVEAGDQILAFPSVGFHSNGFSLLRKLFERDMEEWKETLLKPTALYVKPVKKLLKAFNKEVKALAHITGGGLDNILRVLPHGVKASLWDWTWPSCFVEAQKRSGLSREEICRILNCGLGMVVVVQKKKAQEIQIFMQEEGYHLLQVGEVVEAENDSSPSWEFV
ncbi:MAG: phosphoribosylformylglycinamidine cyclo-ligase [Bdellovibrio sp.]|nr:MAG: phosphoribosylformylglycinamidine cyclo-ligase [Bdellovibrio sp.]